MPAGALARNAKVLSFGEVNPLPGWKPHLEARAEKYVRAVLATNTPLPLAEDPADIPVAARPGAQPNSTPLTYSQPRARNR